MNKLLIFKVFVFGNDRPNTLFLAHGVLFVGRIVIVLECLVVMAKLRYLKNPEIRK